MRNEAETRTQLILPALQAAGQATVTDLLDRATAGLQGLYPDLDAAWPHIQRSHETR